MAIPKRQVELNRFEVGMIVRAAACQILELHRKIKRAKKAKNPNTSNLACLAATAVDADALFRKFKALGEAMDVERLAGVDGWEKEGK